MTARRKVGLGMALAAAIVLIATALPGFAAPKSKIFTLNMAPPSLTAGAETTSQSLTATFKNVSPAGTGSINSLTLTASGGPTDFQITGATSPSGSRSFASDHKTLTITNMTPVNSGATFVVGLTVSVPAASSCTNSTVTWDAVPWNGSSPGSGSTFKLDPSQPSSITTTIVASTGATALTFDGPNGAQPTLYNEIGTAIQGTGGGPVKVYVTNGCGGPVANGTTVTMSIGTDPTEAATLNGVQGGTETQTTTSGVASFSDLMIAPTSSGFTLHASAGSAGADSATFHVTNTLPVCTTDCTATFPNGTSTVSAPDGTVLIIETNQLTCDSVGNNFLAGTVAIIPTPGPGVIPIEFADYFGGPGQPPVDFQGPFPFCKTLITVDPDTQEVTETPHDVALCSSATPFGTEPPAAEVPCVQESVEFTGTGPVTATLHSILWMTTDDPHAKH